MIERDTIDDRLGPPPAHSARRPKTASALNEESSQRTGGSSAGGGLAPSHTQVGKSSHAGLRPEAGLRLCVASSRCSVKQPVHSVGSNIAT